MLGSATDPGIEIEIALRKHALPFEFSQGGERQAKRLPEEVRPADRKGRVDLTALPLVTIDGETAKDFDDAVYCERKGKGFRLIVAIADVVALRARRRRDRRDARERGTSVYFPRRVIPMLPEELSNELCSLKANVDRLCMACDMEVTAQGAIDAYEFYPGGHAFAGAPHVHAGVGVAVGRRQRAKSADAKALLPHLANLYALFKALPRRARSAARSTSTRVELAIEFDEHGKIARIVPAPRNDAHKLIEECMLAANVCAADFLAKHQQPILFRVHERPPPDKLAALREFLATSALHLAGGEQPPPADYAKLLDSVRERAGLRSCCRRCCCARCRRRSTGRTTTATSASPTKRTRTSRRRSAAIPICSCTARSRRCSRASTTRLPA